MNQQVNPISVLNAYTIQLQYFVDDKGEECFYFWNTDNNVIYIYMVVVECSNMYMCQCCPYACSNSG
jgi:hypothetical protein